MEVLYPTLKKEFLDHGRPPYLKKEMLKKFQSDGFYLLDLLDSPKKNYGKNLSDVVPELIKRVKSVETIDTPIILIKANAFDLAYQSLLAKGFQKVYPRKIPFPSSGQQGKLRKGFEKALEYFKL